MKCRLLQVKLEKLPAGECTFSERARLESHLARCRRCRGKLEELKAAENLLDGLAGEIAPPGLYESIMSLVQKTLPEQSGRPRPGFSARAVQKRNIAAEVRGMALAAAVALTIFWTGTWFSPVQTVVAFRPVRSCMHYTEATVRQFEQSFNALWTTFLGS